MRFRAERDTALRNSAEPWTPCARAVPGRASSHGGRSGEALWAPTDCCLEASSSPPAQPPGARRPAITPRGHVPVTEVQALRPTPTAPACRGVRQLRASRLPSRPCPPPAAQEVHLPPGWGGHGQTAPPQAGRGKPPTWSRPSPVAVSQHEKLESGGRRAAHSVEASRAAGV